MLAYALAYVMYKRIWIKKNCAQTNLVKPNSKNKTNRANRYEFVMEIWPERSMTKRDKRETKMDAFMIMDCACIGCMAHFKSACQPLGGGGIRPADKLSVPNQTAWSQSFVWLPAVLCVQIIGILIRINNELSALWAKQAGQKAHRPRLDGPPVHKIWLAAMVLSNGHI